jgi:Ca2+-binding RTX toxin-like protein
MDGKELNGGPGDDMLIGGDGDDRLSDSAGGSDTLIGGAGKDEIRISRQPGNAVDTIVIDAGADDDYVFYYSFTSGSTTIDLGAGNDRLDLNQNYSGAVRATLGSGQDRVTLAQGYDVTWGFNSLTFADFAVGAGGDVLDLNAFLTQRLVDWDGGNPFATGHLSLVQSGSSTRLRLDLDGAAANNRGTYTLATFENTTVTAFTRDNFNGLAPDGTMDSGQTIVGTEGFDTLRGTDNGDVIHGLGGADTIEGAGGADLAYGDDGADIIRGDVGDDKLYGGAGNDQVEGGRGSDVLDGGDGDDLLRDADSGSDTLIGGAGKDDIRISHFHFNSVGGETIVVDAGADDDYVYYSNSNQGSTTIDLGSGDDLLRLDQNDSSALLVTLGAGRDRVTASGYYGLNPYTDLKLLTFADFTGGVDGDDLNLHDLLALNLINWDGSNPFGAANYLHLTQSGSDTLVQIDRDGSSAGNHGYVTFATLRNTLASTLTADNFNGFAPDGTRAAATAIVSSLSVTEGVDTSAPLSMLLKNVSSASGFVRISFDAAGSTATNGIDTNVSSSSLAYDVFQIPSGPYTAALGSIGIVDDLVAEGDETIAIRLQAPTQVFETGTNTTIVTITVKDNDAIGTVAADTFTGDAGQNAFYGLGGDDLLAGLAGLDLLDGGDGNDILLGGAGIDTLTGGTGADVFRGTTADMAGDRITDLAIGDRINVSDATYDSSSFTRAGATLSFGGTTVDIGNTNIRLVTAASATGGVDLVAANRDTGLADFDGNGHSDLLWREAGGDFSTWSVSGNADGNQIAKNSTYVDGVGTNWTIAETFDFNGDGRSDILWREQNAGQFTIWNGQGSSWAQNSYSNNTVSSDWTIAGVGDLNGDGRDDIVWRQDGGDFSTWQSTGTGFNTNVTYDSSVAPDWQVVGLADFNGDNKDDLLWRNQGSGAFSIWSSTGDGFTPNTYYDAGVDRSWHIDGLADFNGDGKDDILWRHDGDGALTTWQSTGSGFNLNVYDDKSVNPVWQVANTGDFNNDGKADLMFRNVADGTFTTWESNGNGFDPNVVSDSSVGTDWQIQAHDLQFG